jgi:DDB1- and CUL4-associated factor 5
MSAPPNAKPTNTCNLLQVLNNLSNGRDPASVRGNLFRARLDVAKNLYKKDLVSHFGCVNAIEFDKTGQYLISGESIRMDWMDYE